MIGFLILVALGSLITGAVLVVRKAPLRRIQTAFGVFAVAALALIVLPEVGDAPVDDGGSGDTVVEAAPKEPRTRRSTAAVTTTITTDDVDTLLAELLPEADMLGSADYIANDTGIESAEFQLLPDSVCCRIQVSRSVATREIKTVFLSVEQVLDPDLDRLYRVAQALVLADGHRSPEEDTFLRIAATNFRNGSSMAGRADPDTRGRYMISGLNSPTTTLRFSAYDPDE